MELAESALPVVSVDSKCSVKGLEGSAQSLLLPLCSRAFETRQSSPIVRDDKAVELLAQLDYDPTPIQDSWLYHTLICLRTRRFDLEVAEFLRAHPDGMVVNLGCGLDTRFERVANGRGTWVEVDFPEVIELRAALLEQGSRRRFVPCSITDRAWFDPVAAHAGPKLFIAEGVFMFVDGAELRGLVTELARRFPGSNVMFDAVKPIEVSLRRYHPTLRRTQAALRWGLPNSASVLSWHPSLRLVGEWHYCDENEPRLRWYRLMRHIPWLGRTAWILRFAMDP